MEQIAQPAMSSIKATVRRFVLQNFLFANEESRFEDSDSFLAKGIVDSTGILELIEFLERTYGLQMEDEEMIPENLDSVDNVCRYLLHKTRQAVA